VVRRWLSLSQVTSKNETYFLYLIIVSTCFVFRNFFQL
jgi:hypothetical protein